MMNRRSFLKNTSLVSGAFMVPGFLKPYESAGLVNPTERSLVVIQLSGGNDGLNMIIPYADDLYYGKRPTISIASNQVIRLNAIQGMNPAMNKLKPVYDQGFMAIVNEVGYPNPDRSHFRSMDIWQTGSNSNEFLSTGWLGRYLDASCRKGSKSSTGIELDDSLSLAMKGVSSNGIALKNAAQLYHTTQEPFFKTVAENQPHHLTEDTLGYLYKTLVQTYSSAEYIYETSKKYRVTATYPDTGFASQLKTISQFINSGLQTKVYYISMSGFDTHVGQLSQQNRLLGIFADGLAAFLNDLKSTGKLDTTLVMAFSEFGRRAEQNASNGTDHGTANNVLLFSGALKNKGILTPSPDLLNLQGGDLVYKTDFRNVYATILQKWLDVADLSVLSGPTEPLNFI